MSLTGNIQVPDSPPTGPRISAYTPFDKLPHAFTSFSYHVPGFVPYHILKEQPPPSHKKQTHLSIVSPKMLLKKEI